MQLIISLADRDCMIRIRLLWLQDSRKISFKRKNGLVKMEKDP